MGDHLPASRLTEFDDVGESLHQLEAFVLALRYLARTQAMIALRSRGDASRECC